MTTNTVTKIWTKEEIADNLARNPRSVMNAIVGLYKRQTQDEQIRKATRYQNGQGFNGCDAAFGTSLAENVLQYGRLTPNQLNAARKMLHKYMGQLTRIANHQL